MKLNDHGASVVAHCDWSIAAKKRVMMVAVRQGARWRLDLPEPVGDTGTLLQRLGARALQDGPVLIGFDFPIGLPARYGERTGFASFRHALRGLGRGDWAQWFDVAGHISEISIHRPFYPMRPGGTKRLHLFDALGLGHGGDLSRRCETATSQGPAASMLFWTLGGNQVGKAAISGWREIILPNLDTVGLWPFDGPLSTLLKTCPVVIAETYPGNGYGQLGISRRPNWSKRKQDGRRSVSPVLTAWLDSRPVIAVAELAHIIADGFGPDPSGEDPFDATVGLFAMLDVHDGRRPEGTPQDADIMTWEGWILGKAER